MKKSIFSLILVLLIAVTVFGGELIFKTEKEVKTSNSVPVTIVEFDTAGKNKIRIGVAGEIEKDFGAVTVQTLDGSNAIQINKIVVENGESSSVLIELPGKRIRLSANTSGKYKVFVWSE